MNAPLILPERHCPNCRLLRPVDQFRSHRYCVECQADYHARRYQRMQDGSWKPKTPAERAPQRPRILPGAKPVTPACGPELKYTGPAPAVSTPDQEAQLRHALEAFMVEFGFTALRVVYARLEGEIARKHRRTLARDGWIA
jgi:hypothetical protein